MIGDFVVSKDLQRANFLGKALTSFTRPEKVAREDPLSETRSVLSDHAGNLNVVVL